MATNTIPGATPVCKAAASTSFDASCAFDGLQLDAERISETAFALSASEVFGSNAQLAFYAIGQLACGLEATAKQASDSFMALSRAFQGEVA